MLREMEALDLFAQGRHAEAFAHDGSRRRAAGAHAEADRPAVSGEGRRTSYTASCCCRSSRPRRRSRWFDRVLARTPNRSRALLGLARAHRNAGDAANARAAYKRLLTNYRLADPGLPEVAEARAAVK